MAFNIDKKTRVVTYNIACTVEDQEYTLYTCPPNARAMMSLLFVSNANGNTTVDIEWNRADGTHMHILGGKNMVAGDYIQFSDGYVVFEPGDSMAVTASGNATPHIDVLCTVEEIFLPVGG